MSEWVALGGGGALKGEREEREKRERERESMWLVESAKKAAAYAAGADNVKVNGSNKAMATTETAVASASNQSRNDAGGGGGGAASTSESESETKQRNLREKDNNTRREKLLRILNNSLVDIEELKTACWGGIPQDLRPICWQLMLGYLPSQTSSWQDVVHCKRKAYRELLRTHYEVSNSRKSEEELAILRQIAIDAPRTEPSVKLFSKSALQRSLIRILYIRACTHPSSGYVQGLNDVLTPFLHVFLSRVFPGEMGTWDVDSIHDDKLIDIEGDCYWCFCKLMDRVEDMYTRGQPGIRRCVKAMEVLLKRVDGDLFAHMEKEGLELIHFTVRWFNCLIMRELPFGLVCRLWDTYISEGDNFHSFVVFVALSLLVSFSEKLQTMDFQEMIMHLQKLPTSDWTSKELEMVLSEAFLWHTVFQDTKL